jgi:hypothetical protein
VADEVQPVHVRHVPVDEGQLGHLRHGGEQVERFPAVGRLDRLEVQLGDDALEDHAHRA